MLAPIIGTATDTSYQWHYSSKGERLALLRTVTTLAWRQEGVQFVLREHTGEVAESESDYAAGVAYANALELADFESSLHM